MFDWEYGIALHAMHGNRASSLDEGEFSWFSSSCRGNMGYILELRWGWTFKTRVCSATSELLSIYVGYLRIVNYAWQDNTDASRSEVWDRWSFSSWHSDIGIANNIQELSGIVNF